MLKLHLHKLNYVGTLFSSLISFLFSLFFVVLFENGGKGEKEISLRGKYMDFPRCSGTGGTIFNSELKRQLKFPNS
jgi:hypothetical protein